MPAQNCRSQAFMLLMGAIPKAAFVGEPSKIGDTPAYFFLDIHDILPFGLWR